MAFRIPRGYAVNRPSYQEISEGVRPEAHAVPMVAYTGLPAVRTDELHHDPIVIDAGTIVGIASGGNASGKIFPAHGITGASTITLTAAASDNTNWGISNPGAVAASTLTDGPVKPLGVVYQPIYSFHLETQFTNYKRNDNVGFVTDYLIQVPAETANERAIEPGDLVMCNPTATTYSATRADTDIGRYQAWTPGNNTATELTNLQYVIGRCVRRLEFAIGTASTKLSDDYSNIALTTDGSSEFKGLDKVQTVPGLGLAGSATKGVPSWLTSAVSASDGKYSSLLILVRL